VDELKIINGVLKQMYGSVAIAHKVAERAHMTMDDFRQIGRIAIWKAQKKYIPDDRKSLESYTFDMVRFDLLKEIRRKGNIIAIPHFRKFEKYKKDVSSLNVTVDEKENQEIQDLLPGESLNEDNILNRIVLEQKINSLGEQDKYIVVQLLKGKSQLQIGKELNMSQMNVSRRYRQAIEKMKEEAV
jgi:RNA polymerase sigma factor (sigma-70 family)